MAGLGALDQPKTATHKKTFTWKKSFIRINCPFDKLIQ